MYLATVPSTKSHKLLTLRGVPQVQAGTEAHGHHVVRASIDKVQIEVINQIWSIQDLIRYLRHISLDLII